jgi:hypothetical protein
MADEGITCHNLQILFLFFRHTIPFLALVTEFSSRLSATAWLRISLTLKTSHVTDGIALEGSAMVLALFPIMTHLRKSSHTGMNSI